MDNKTSDNIIDAVLASRPPGLWPFIPAGYPDLPTTTALLAALDELPIRGIELGLPFSDSVADGPVIQQAFGAALANHIRMDDIFDAVTSIRSRLQHPLLAMVSASIVYRMGIQSFVTKSSHAGFDGLIVPDISLEEAPLLAELVGDAGLRLSMLVAPTTPVERQKRIAEVASGFLYYVSIQGTTGVRKELPTELPAQVRALKKTTGLPVLVGFGISDPSHVKQVCTYADGAIVGSAIVRRMIETHERGLRGERFVQAITTFVRELATE